MRLHKRASTTPYECWLEYNASMSFFYKWDSWKRKHNPYFWHTRKWEDGEDGWKSGMKGEF